MYWQGDLLWGVSVVHTTLVFLFVTACTLVALFPEFVPGHWVGRIREKGDNSPAAETLGTAPLVVRRSWGYYWRKRGEPQVINYRIRLDWMYLIRKAYFYLCYLLSWWTQVTPPSGEERREAKDRKLLCLDEAVGFSTPTGFSCLLYRHTA